MWYSYENIGLEDPIYVPPLPGLSLLTSMPISTTFESTLIITFGIQFTCGSPNYLSFDFRFEGTNRSSDSYATLFHEGGGLGYHSVTVIEENVSTGNYNLDVYWTAQDGDFTFYITDWSIVAVAYPLT